MSGTYRDPLDIAIDGLRQIDEKVYTFGMAAAILQEVEKAAMRTVPDEQRVTSAFLRSLLKEATPTGDPEVDPISVGCTAENMRKICEELLTFRAFSEVFEPAAWMAEDGRLIKHELKSTLTPRSSVAAFIIPLYPPIQLERITADKTDPLAAHRWICAHCSTVNAIAAVTCVSCRKPKKAR